MKKSLFDTLPNKSSDDEVLNSVENLTGLPSTTNRTPPKTHTAENPITQNKTEQAINNGTYYEKESPLAPKKDAKPSDASIKKEETGNNYYDLIDSAANISNENYTEQTPYGSGEQAASGTGGYSWEKQGIEKAQDAYTKQLLEVGEEKLANAQQIANNALNYQVQADMMKYQNNQSAEKVGWTGGQVLSQERQMEYLKASINAQMYNAIQLQKYGYDSALSAARLAYDLNQKEYAQQYYKDAITIAMQEASLTGVYVSAESRDMMAQFNASQRELQELGAYDPETGTVKQIDTNKLTSEQLNQYNKAIAVRKSIIDWYGGSNVSERGVQTLEAYTIELENNIKRYESLLDTYTSAMKTIESDDRYNSSLFIRYDKYGNPVYNGFDIETFDFNKMTSSEMMEYANSGSQMAKEQFYGYLEGKVEEAARAYISNNTNKNDKETEASYKGNQSDFALAINSSIKPILDSLSKENDSNSALSNWSYTTTDSKGNEVIITKDGVKVITYDSENSEINELTEQELQEEAKKKETQVRNYADTISNYFRNIYQDVVFAKPENFTTNNFYSQIKDLDFSKPIAFKDKGFGTYYIFEKGELKLVPWNDKALNQVDIYSIDGNGKINKE